MVLCCFISHDSFLAGVGSFLEPSNIALTLAKSSKRKSIVVLRHCPVKRHAPASSLLERLAERRDGLLKPGRAVLALTKCLERSTEIVLRPSPSQRCEFASLFRQCGATGRNRLGEP